MSRKKRDYRAEYKRRIAKGVKKGLSRSQARGHRRAHESLASTRRKARPLDELKFQRGLFLLRKGEPLASAAKSVGVSRERLRNYAAEKKAIEKNGRKWVVKQNLPRRVLIYSKGQDKAITVGTFEQASLVGRYMSAVGQYLRTGDASVLKPFIGKSVRDIDGKSHRLETGPKTLYRIAHTATSTFEQIYRYVI